MSSNHQVKAVSKAFNVLEVLASKGELQLHELSGMLKYPKTSLHRMLLTLEALGYVQQNPRSSGFSASIKIFELGGKVVHNLNLVDIARPFMIELSEQIGETINLGILDGDDIICIDKVESKHHLKLDQPIGYRAKAYYTAMGKAVLAYLSDEERAQIFSKHTIISSPSRPLKTVNDIENELQKVREQGYSVDNEEYMAGVRCVGAPIFTHTSKVAAGLSIAGPSLHIREENFESLAQLVKGTAGSISKALGFSPEFARDPHYTG